MFSKIACIAVATTSADALELNSGKKAARAAREVGVISQCKNGDGHWNLFSKDPIPTSMSKAGLDFKDQREVEDYKNLISETHGHCSYGPDFLSTAEDKYNCENPSIKHAFRLSMTNSKPDCTVEDRAYSEALKYLLDRAPRTLAPDSNHQFFGTSNHNHGRVCVLLGGGQDNPITWEGQCSTWFTEEKMDLRSLARWIEGARARWIEGAYYELAKDLIDPTRALEKARTTQFDLTGRWD